jgi:hypothetical protein
MSINWRPGRRLANAQELHKRYGEPTMERFEVRSGITLTAEHGPDRRACQLLVAPAQSLLRCRIQFHLCRHRVFLMFCKSCCL